MKREWRFLRKSSSHYLFTTYNCSRPAPDPFCRRQRGGFCFTVIIIVTLLEFTYYNIRNVEKPAGFVVLIGYGVWQRVCVNESGLVRMKMGNATQLDCVGKKYIDYCDWMNGKGRNMEISVKHWTIVQSTCFVLEYSGCFHFPLSGYNTTTTNEWDWRRLQPGKG